jgi:calcineurin-like phosphoesterase family protein
MNTFLISDTHFGHKNILNFLTKEGVPLRKFNDSSHMDEYMIEAWNSVVKPTDKVYHLGDVAITSFNNTKEIFDRLNGTKILIKGNHDKDKLSQYAQIFKDVRAYHILDNILLAHIPIHPESLSRWKGQVHGHLHSNNVMLTETLPDSRYYNVSVEQIDYTPIPLELVRKHYA